MKETDINKWATLFKQRIECNGNFQHLQLFDFPLVFTYLGGYLKLYFCSIGAVGGRLLLVEIPMHQSFRNAQTDELTAAVMGKDKSKRG